MRFRPLHVVVLVVVLAAGVAGLAAKPGGAQAGKFSVRLCGDATNGWTYVPTDPGSSNKWRLDYECPSKWIAIRASEPVYGSGIWRFPLGASLTSVTGTVIGNPDGGDIQYQVKLCTTSFYMCNGQVLPIVQTDPNFPTLRVRAQSTDPWMPMNVSDIHVEARCTLGPGETCAPPQDTQCEDPLDECDPEPAFGLAGLVIEATDDIAPELNESINETPADVPNRGWVSAKGGNIKLYATDEGSGVNHLQVMASVLGSTITSVNFPVYSGCSSSTATSTFFRMCPKSWHANIPIEVSNTRFSKQGMYVLRIRAYDMARVGSDEFQRVFYLDSILPQKPGNLGVTGGVNLNGTTWVGGSGSIASWDPIVADGGSELQTVIVDVDPADGGEDDPYPFELTGSPTAPSSVPISWPSPGKWKLSVRVKDNAGNVGPPSETLVNVDQTKPSKLEPRVPAWVGEAFLDAGRQVVWDPPLNLSAMLSNVCSYETAVSGESTPPAFGLTQNGPGVAGSPLPPDLAEGRWYFHIRAVSCAGHVGPFASVAFDVDRTAPDAFADKPARHWLGPLDRFVVRGTDDGGSGVDKISFTDNGNSSEVHAGWAEPELTEGEHVFTFESVDGAGNASGPRTVDFGVDRTIPTGKIVAQDPAAPARITAEARDAHSGIARAELQYRKLPGGEWTTLGVPATAQEDGLAAATVSADFPDAELPDGSYAIRLLATDRVGQRRAVYMREGGGTAIVHSPVRVQPVVSLNLTQKQRKKKCKRRSNCIVVRRVASRIVDMDSRVPVVGRATLPGGGPLAGHTVRLHEKNEFSNTVRVVSEVTTGSDGAFEGTVPPGPNRRIYASTAESDRYRTSNRAEVVVRAPAELSLRVSDRDARQYQRLKFSGQLRLGNAKLTALGQMIEIQYAARDGWKPLVSGRSEQDGSFLIAYTALPVGSPLKMTVRAFVSHSAVWPYLDGASRPVRLVIRP